jgi:hypothetical protein
MNLNISKHFLSLVFLFACVLEISAQIPEQESHNNSTKPGKGSKKETYKAQPEFHNNNLHGLSSYYINAGLSNYYGDLSRGKNCFIMRPGFGAGYNYRWNRRISFRSEFNYYRLYSNDYYEQRNFSFRSANTELYAGLTYDIIPYTLKFQYRDRFIPYVFGGIGVTHFNPQGKYNGQWYELAPLRTEGKGYSRWSPIIPFGLGVRIKCLSSLDLLLEVGFRKTFTDYLDDVSSHEFQSVDSFSNPVAAALSNRTGMGDNYTQYRGNPHKKDMYAISQVKFVYTPREKFLLKHMMGRK